MSAEEPRTSPDRPALFAVAVLVGYAVMGVLAGVVWQWLYTPPTQIVHAHQLYYADHPSLRRVFSGTGLYAVVGAVASALTALVVTLLARRRELLTLVLVLVGSSLAAVLMRQVGIALGPGNPATAAAHAADGTRLQGQLAVSGSSPYLVWPMLSLFVTALVFFSWPGPARSEVPAGRARLHATDDPHDPDVSGVHRR